MLAIILRHPPVRLDAPATAEPPGPVGVAVSITLRPGLAPPAPMALQAMPTPAEPAPPTPAAAQPDIVMPGTRPTDTVVDPEPPKLEPMVDSARLDGDSSQDPMAASVTASSLAAQGSCRLGPWLQEALQSDPAVQRALPTIPRSNRSVSNALMLWDARWVAQPPSAAVGVSAIRTALMIGVRSAPRDCLLQPVRGPELITLADASGTLLLAIGSGEWRWADLLETPDLTR